MGVESSSPIVHTKALCKQVDSPAGRLSILENIDLSIPGGQTAAIVGRSGSGKSTLLSLLAGLDVSSSGEVWLFTKALSALNEDQRAALRAGRVGFVFQSFQLLPHLSALENVALPLELARSTQAGEQAEQALAQVGLAQRLHHYPNQLSGGEQQRVAIARAFAVGPELIFADEPTGNLDQKTGGAVIELLFRLNQVHHTTLVMVTHDLALTRDCALVFELEDGRLDA